MGDEQVFGAKLESLGSSDMRSMNVDSGVKIVELNDGKFKDLGLKRGYVILSVNGKKVKNSSDVRQFTNNGSTLKSISGVGIQSDGSIFNFQFGN
jgi:S1-C subfamily serine protease